MNLFKNKNNIYSSFKKNQLQYFRMVLLMGIIFYISFGLILKFNQLRDFIPFSHRLIISSFLFILFFITYLSKSVKNNITIIINITAYILLLHWIYISSINHFSSEVVLSIIIVILTFNFVFEVNQYYLLFNIGTITLFSITIMGSGKPVYTKLLYVITIILVSWLSYFFKKNEFLQHSYFIKLFNNSPDAIAFIDNNDKLIKANKSFYSLFLFKENETSGKKIEKLIVPENLIKESNIIKEKVKNGQTINLETMRMKKDGTLFEANILAYPMYQGNKYKGYFLNIRNITERKNTIRMLKQSEAKTRNYIDKAPIGIFITNKKGEYIDVNKTACLLTGFTRKELLNMTIDDISSPEVLDKVRLDYNLLIKNGNLTAEYPLIDKMGKRYFVKINATKLREDRYIGFAENITSRVKAEEVLVRQKAYFQQLFDNSPEAIALLDNQERIIKINKSFEEIFGYKQKEIRGKPINQILVPEEKIKESKSITCKVKRGNIVTEETIRKTKSGKIINVSVLGYPIKLNNKQVGIYAVYNDITKRKLEEEKIKYLSFRDQLTGLYNRRYFENEILKLKNSRRVPISIIVGDLDKLKSINDNFGHKEGDRYIKIAGNIIDSVTRSEDVVARIGGDEFAVILPETDYETAVELKNRILQKCKEFNEFLVEPISISLGCATKYSDENLEKIFVKADKKMYNMKESRK